MSNSHKSAPLGQIHAIHNFEYASAAARTSAAYAAADVGKVVRQTDDSSFWLIASVAAGVAAFQGLGAVSAGPAGADGAFMPVRVLQGQVFNIQRDTQIKNHICFNNAGVVQIDTGAVFII